ncbi:hypothetical protein INT47_003116 [Mucor saturninus]|uniref:Retrotransposon gag domain-containing protein n=1 Tax=Mucor saturninus TaxID=64648 RepID=A0A8H7QK30_9FUNG|nr:hypothetical protein INT47_003116 [Mucor saturninus]
MEEDTPEPETVSRNDRVIPDLEEEEDVNSSQTAPVPVVTMVMAFMDVDTATSFVENRINVYQRKLDIMIKRIASLEASMSPRTEDKLDYRNDLVKAPPSASTYKVLFESIEHYVHQFEMTIQVSRNQIEDKTKEVLTKKFGNLRSKETNCIKLFDLRMTNNQTVVEYRNKFINLVVCAELNKDDKILVLLYRASLLEPCRQHISAAVEARKQVDPQHQFSIKELYDMGRDIFVGEIVLKKVQGAGNQVTSINKICKEGTSVEYHNCKAGKTATSSLGCRLHDNQQSSHTTA